MIFMRNAVLFLDFNGTIDDINLKGGRKFTGGLNKLSAAFDEVDIVVITAAKNLNAVKSIREEFCEMLAILPKPTRQKFKYLIESNNLFISKIDCQGEYPKVLNAEKFCESEGNKQTGVKKFIETTKKNYSMCIIAGDDEKIDLPMLYADVNIPKYFIFASKRKLKNHISEIYKVNLSCHIKTLNYAQEISQNLDRQSLKIIQTSTKSYGVGVGLEVLASYLQNTKETCFDNSTSSQNLLLKPKQTSLSKELD